MNEIDKLHEEIVLLKLAITERDDEIGRLKENVAVAWRMYDNLYEDYENLQDNLNFLLEERDAL